jgi:hypothetical protein
MLKYLKSLESNETYSGQIDLEMNNDFGISPIVYAMMHQNVYCFIYMRHKLGC